MASVRVPRSITMERKTKEITIHWQDGTPEELVRAVKPLIRAGEWALLDEQMGKTDPMMPSGLKEVKEPGVDV